MYIFLTPKRCSMPPRARMFFFFRSRFSRTRECLLYNDIQYTFCAQGKEARVLFVFSF